MTTECSSTANSITEVLLAGDAVLNLTQQPLNTLPGTQFIAVQDARLTSVAMPAAVVWNYSLAFSLSSLINGRVTRLVIVSEENCSHADFVVRELAARNVPHLHCTLLNICDSDAFMDEQDAEAVTERLRQLGYI
ncbi:MAG: hypothetical protein DWH78_05765 [Planctomycetota bacterium]|jgi:hypothetical protein|nr:MAG: hypothetical protein DWH78_05765 [Planctomycetota bacterium]